MAGSLATTSATTKLYYTATLPTTYDNSGYTALTGWVLIGEVSSLGTYGGKTSVQKHVPIDTATVVKRAGSVDYGTMSITAARHKGADITALTTAFAARTSGAYKVVLPTAIGDTDYFTAICTSIQTNIGNADQILQSNIELELDSAVITVSAP